MKLEEISKRQLILISLIGSGGSIKTLNEPIEGSIKLMKEAFLLKMELGKMESGNQLQYHFVPYDFGPCSFEIYEELNSLIKGGIIKEDKHKTFSIYSIADSYEEVIPKLIGSLEPEVKAAVMRIKRNFNGLSYYGLITHVYEKYPSYIKASKFRL